MKALNIDLIAQEILTDMSLREKASIANANPSDDPELEAVFESLIQEDDDTGKAVMRKIWEELKETHRIRRVK